MDQTNNIGDNKGINENDGLVVKSANVQAQEATDAELRAINKLALTPLASEEVFTFKVAMCDNEIDRDFEVFPLSTLQQLQKLYVGKTVIKDHSRTSDNQIARIYSTELVQDGAKVSKTGELYTQLVAHCYMLNNEANKNLIADIKAGIKKEVSVGCATNKAVCSICGTDNRKEYCKHFWGRVYDGKTCHFSLEDAKDAYEVSFVAVPAQPRAGTVKNYGAKKDKLDLIPPIDKSNNDNIKEQEINLKIKSLGSFLFVEQSKEKNS